MDYKFIVVKNNELLNIRHPFIFYFMLNESNSILSLSLALSFTVSFSLSLFSLSLSLSLFLRQVYYQSTKWTISLLFKKRNKSNIHHHLFLFHARNNIKAPSRLHQGAIKALLRRLRHCPGAIKALCRRYQGRYQGSIKAL